MVTIVLQHLLISQSKHTSNIKCEHLLKTENFLPPSKLVPQDSKMVAKQHRLAYRL